MPRLLYSARQVARISVVLPAIAGATGVVLTANAFVLTPPQASAGRWTPGTFIRISDASEALGATSAVELLSGFVSVVVVLRGTTTTFDLPLLFGASSSAPKVVVGQIRDWPIYIDDLVQIIGGGYPDSISLVANWVVTNTDAINAHNVTITDFYQVDVLQFDETPRPQ